MHKFEPADRVVIPGLGVGTVASIESVPVDGSDVDAYRVEFDEDRGRLWVPVARAGAAGMRPPMTEDLAKEALEVAGSQKAPKKRAHWNRRQRRYQEWLTSSNPHDVARLVGELASVRKVKKGPLSFGERRLFEKGKEILVRELSAALGIAQALAEKRLDKRLAA